MHCEGCAGSVRKTIRRIPGAVNRTSFHFIFSILKTQMKD
jgi:copper chaperone CopZ